MYDLWTRYKPLRRTELIAGAGDQRPVKLMRRTWRSSLAHLVDRLVRIVILEGHFTIPAAQERVWKAIWDVPTLASWVPGCTSAEEIGEDRYRVHLEQQVAFMKAAFDLLLTVVERHEPDRVALSGEGEDRRLGSNISIQTTVELVPNGPDETELRYRHDLSVFGKLGALGFPIIQHKVREAEKEFAQRARATLAETDLPGEASA